MDGAVVLAQAIRVLLFWNEAELEVVARETVYTFDDLAQRREAVPVIRCIRGRWRWRMLQTRVEGAATDTRRVALGTGLGV